MERKRLSKEYTLNNSKGLHARPASIFVQTANTFQAEIEVFNLKSEMSADGKSVMSLLMLAAPFGTKIRITATGADAEEALHHLGFLVESGFNDD